MRTPAWVKLFWMIAIVSCLLLPLTLGSMMVPDASDQTLAAALGAQVTCVVSEIGTGVKGNNIYY